MTQLKDWLQGFLDRHAARFAPHDWPDPETEASRDFLRLWFEAFNHANVQEHEADAASVRLGVHPPTWQREHLPAVIKEIDTMRRANAEASTGDRAVAKRLAEGCPYCDGNGLVTVYHRGWTGAAVGLVEIDGEEKMIATEVAAHCVCALGRWVRAKTEREMLMRIPDLQRVLDGRLPYTVERPDIGPGDEIRSIAELRAFCRFVSRQGGVGVHVNAAS